MARPRKAPAAAVKPPPRPPLATPAEVGAYLRRPVTTLKQWRWLGVGPKYIRQGEKGDVLYDWEDVYDWAERNKHETADGVPAAS